MKLTYDDKARLDIYKSEIKRLRQNIVRTDRYSSEVIEEMTALLKQYVMMAKMLDVEGDFDV